MTSRQNQTTLVHQTRAEIAETEVSLPIHSYEAEAGILTHDNGKHELYVDLKEKKGATERYRLTGKPLNRYLAFLKVKKINIRTACVKVEKTAAGSMKAKVLSYPDDAIVKKAMRNPQFKNFLISHSHGDVRRITSGYYNAVATEISTKLFATA